MATGIRLAPFLLAVAIALAQDSAPRPAPAAANTVIRIDVNLVQVDAIVTDSRDRRVPNLQAADFEIRQDGKPQPITNFSYVSTKSDAPAPPHRAAQAKPVKGEPPPPPEPPQPSEVRRTLALVVDDLGLAAEDFPPVRAAIRNFIDQQMRPGDLVAIVRTSAGMGALQQFTTDKRMLDAALARVQYSQNRVGVSSFAPLGSGGRGAGAFNRYREETETTGSLAAIEFVVNAMRGFPGRKSVILFTEDIRLIYQRTTDETMASAVRQLTDAASRASVVIHAIDPRGVVDYAPTSADNTGRMSGRRISRVSGQREQQVAYREEGMSVLAEETGGLFLHDTNDLSGALQKAAEDSDGYYLIGYRPDASTFENGDGLPKLHKVEVKVKRSGLHVRSRDGFFGEPDGSQPVERSRDAQLALALQSPYATGSLHPRLTAVFSNERQTGSAINALLYFDPKELKWSSEPDGSHKALVDVAAATFDEDGLSLAPINTTFTLQLNPQRYDAALKEGMIYGMRVPVNRAGPYQVRAAVRDASTEGAGSAEQYVEVPDVENGHLALSGILFQDAARKPPANADLARGPAPGVDVTGGSARRSFHRGAMIDYFYEIINANTGASQPPELDVQTRLFHDGEQVLSGKSTLAGAGAPDPQRLMASGRMALGRNLAPGQYVLQVIVTGKLAQGKFDTATQSEDFEIEP